MGLDGKGQKCVLAYSGGLDTSVIVKWLADHNFKVVAVCVDVGQQENLDLEEKALASGAIKYLVKDMTKEFVEQGLFQCLKAEAKYEGKYLLGTSVARPFIMKALVEVAQEEGTHLIAHGATGKGNDQCRFELTAYALMPNVEIIAPWRIKEFRELIPGRKEAIDYAAKHNIPIDATTKKPWSTDPNIAHRSHEAGLLEDPMYQPLDSMYQLITPPAKAPDAVTKISIGFEAGIPVSVDGKKMESVKLLEHLNEVGGKNGVGLLDMVENRFVGMKSRGVYESPAMTILYEAHRDLEGICMDRDLMHLRDSLVSRYSELVYYGFWASRELTALNAFVDNSQKGVTGEVFLELYKGNCKAVGRKSSFSLYDENISTMEGGGSYNQNDATGFLRIAGLPLRVQSSVNKKIDINFFG
ncbi:argininosuccinate synthase [bacterium]|nr:argininosuccinate synthase [bacterium]|tara:strand:+ start:10052 stop:11290 length:1239 start_codon:yes stop_codon:yes gene_type:complete